MLFSSALFLSGFLFDTLLAFVTAHFLPLSKGKSGCDKWSLGATSLYKMTNLMKNGT